MRIQYCHERKFQLAFNLIFLIFGNNISAGTLCKNSGWGKTSNGVLPHMPDELQVVSIPVIEQDTCAELYKEWDLLYDGEVCAGAPDQGSCNVRSSKICL